MFKLLKQFLFLLNLLVLLALLLSYVSSSVDPRVFPYLHFFSLSYLVWLLIACFFCFVWLLLKFKYLLINLLVIAIGLKTHKNNFNFSTQNENDEGLRVASFNSQGLGQAVQGNFDEIMAYAKKEKLDIISILEYKTKHDHKPANWHSQFVPFKDDGLVRPGIKLLSKYPIVKAQKIDFDKTKGNMAIQFEINIKGQKVAIFAVHLETNSVQRLDYQKMKKPVLDSSYIFHAKNLSQKLSRQVATRSLQSKTIINKIKETEIPYLVMGDFNDVPSSFVYQQFTPYTSDAFLSKGFGWGPTYLKPFPIFRIDYILYSKEFTCNCYFSSQEIYSDHKLVGANLSLDGIH